MPQTYPESNPLDSSHILERYAEGTPERAEDAPVYIDKGTFRVFLAEAWSQLQSFGLVDHQDFGHLIDFERDPNVSVELLVESLDEQSSSPPQHTVMDPEAPDWGRTFDLPWSMFRLVYDVARSDLTSEDFRWEMIQILRNYYARFTYHIRPGDTITPRIQDFIDEQLHTGEPRITQIMVPILYGICVDRIGSPIYHLEKDHSVVGRALCYFEAVMKGEIRFDSEETEDFVTRTIFELMHTITTQFRVYSALDQIGRADLLWSAYITEDDLRHMLPKQRAIEENSRRYNRLQPLYEEWLKRILQVNSERSFS